MAQKGRMVFGNNWWVDLDDSRWMGLLQNGWWVWTIICNAKQRRSRS